MNASEIRRTLDEIKDLVIRMASIPEDHRIVAFKSVDPLFLKLEGHLSRNPQARVAELLDEVRLYAIAIARLDETAEEPDSFYCGQVESLVEEIQILLCP